MSLTLILAGIAIGLAMSAPLGPVNIIVIRAALGRGFGPAFVFGLGAVAADMLFAAVAAYGVRSVEQFIHAFAMPLTLAGGILLVVIGVRTAQKHIALSEIGTTEPQGRGAMLRKASGTFALTALNPGTLFGYVAIFGAMSPALRLSLSPERPMLVVLGVAIGGTLWWAFISFAMERLKTRLTEKTLDRISRWTGVLIAAFGFALLMDAVI
jgi:threonine/homoserine/homoserine lactone efflux protein